MIDAPTAAAVVRGFTASDDGEALKNRDLILMLLECSPAPFSGHQFTPGHITCTGLVLAPDSERLLLVHHRRLDRWLLPGGHVKPESEDAEIWDAGRGEVVEETGALLVGDEAPPLAGVDVHGIPSNGREPYHLHHDLIFHFPRVFGEAAALAGILGSHVVRAGRVRSDVVPGSVRRPYGRVRQ